MELIEPDKLLEKPAAVKLGKGIFLSIIVHLALIGLTSFGLYKAWAKWGLFSERGFNTPGVIKQLEKDAAKAAADQAKAESEKASEKVSETVPEPTPQKSEVATSTPAPKPAETAPQQTPLDRQVEKPPKSFDLGEIDL